VAGKSVVQREELEAYLAADLSEATDSSLEILWQDQGNAMIRRAQMF
jgi:hypothetical protein